jgi:hypothetical protein
MRNADSPFVPDRPEHRFQTDRGAGRQDAPTWKGGEAALSSTSRESMLH